MDADLYDRLATEYRPEMRRLAQATANAFSKAGYPVQGPTEQNDNGLQFSFVVQHGDTPEDSVDVIFTMMDGKDYDGSENAVNFSLELIEYGGQVVGCFIPRNYSDDCWVKADNGPAVASRWDEFMAACPPERAVRTLKEHRDTAQAGK